MDSDLSSGMSVPLVSLGVSSVDCCLCMPYLVNVICMLYDKLFCFCFFSLLSKKNSPYDCLQLSSLFSNLDILVFTSSLHFKRNLGINN
jgi:hypothetical protein